ncbi:Aspartate--tRNA ligase [Escovopsis weberi]|uniref:Probable aspartate--tRNA ligase, cytoplasmic n=1 Tax=Escovopsis weberi TaxID=150374 RepID=A0A0M8MXV7_ESCWE|nr:Aspartate--tRNA ligase [Escovopsis weberi]
MIHTASNGPNSPAGSAFGLPLRTHSRSGSQSTSRLASPDRSELPREHFPRPYDAPGDDVASTDGVNGSVNSRTPSFPSSPALPPTYLPFTSSPLARGSHVEASRSILSSLNNGPRKRAVSLDGRSSVDSGRSSSASSEWPTHPFEINTIAELEDLPIGTTVNFRARINTQRQLSKALDFLLLRDQTNSVQGVLSRDNMDMVQWVHKLPAESLVQVNGVLKTPPEPIRSATVSNAEVSINAIHIVNVARHVPYSVYKPPESLRNRMSARIIDLRHPANQALFRIRSTVARLYRETLEDLGFIEISTPKLQPAATESGSSVFRVNYFGRKAFLAQSPQLAKQMAVCSDFGRVFEIGPVFRAENSNTHRHLTEYTGLDLEMAIDQDYHEVIWVLDQFLKAVFKAVYAMPEVEVLQKRWSSSEFKYLDETLILDFRDALQMLRDDGRHVEEEDLSTPDEIRLGQLVKEKYKTDYYVLDRFPTNARPFYTHKDPEDPKWTRSFDMFIRGQEICSGGQRIHNLQELRTNMSAAGIADEGMEEYLAGFELGAPPHAGAGLGLERIITWMLELEDVRNASLFYRDPKSLPEHKLGLPHPDADTTKAYTAQHHPPIEKLIANYGDATNTSWLDDRFEIWRHKSGAAIGYVKQDKFAMMTGDPLCDRSQYSEIVTAFVKFVTSKLHATPIWMLVSYDVQKILAHDLGWRTLSCAEEQRLDTTRHQSPFNGPKHRRVEREGVKIHEVKADEDFIKRANVAIESWKASRKGKQIHMTEVRPFLDTAHRRYFAAEKDGQIMALVVLAKLAPRHGWQVKWALDFPGAVNGSIEVLVEFSLSCVTGQVTFGAGVSEKLTPGENLHGIRAKFLATTYRTVVESLGLRRKADFRSKFGVLGEEVYICYPKHGVGLRDMQQIIKFFQD